MTAFANRRQWQRKESARRAQLNPLRREVNLTLKRAGLSRAKFGTRRVSGTWCMASGWRTESDTFHMRVTVAAEVKDLGIGAGEAAVSLWRTQWKQLLKNINSALTANPLLSVSPTETGCIVTYRGEAR